MWSVRVVALDEDAKQAFQMPPIQDQKPVETLGADGTDKAFGERIRLRRSHRCLDDPDAFAGEDRVEAARELAVAVAEQEAET